MRAKLATPDGKVDGWGAYFNKEGEKVLELEHINIGNEEPYINQEIHYDQGKIVDSVSSFYQIKVKDTVMVNEKINIEIIYHPLISRKSQVWMLYRSSSDTNYYGMEEMKLDSLYIEDFKLNSVLKFLTPGKKYIKGYFKEKQVDYNPVKNDTLVKIKTRTRKMYFKFEVFVKKDSLE